MIQPVLAGEKYKGTQLMPDNNEYLKKSDFWKLAFSALFTIVLLVSSMLVWLETRIAAQLDTIRITSDQNSETLVRLETELRTRDFIK